MLILSSTRREPLDDGRTHTLVSQGGRQRMRARIETENESLRLSEAVAPPDQVAADRADGRAALQAHIDAFARALEQHDRDVVRLAGDRLEAGRRVATALGSCRNWDDLGALCMAWADANSEACLLEARWLVLYADLIRHPAWLARQVEADTRAPAAGRALSRRSFRLEPTTPEALPQPIPAAGT
jgi:hypothetical protein